MGPTVILGVHLVCLGTKNCQKPPNAFFLGPELIYVGKSIQQKILEQLLRETRYLRLYSEPLVLY